MKKKSPIKIIIILIIIILIIMTVSMIVNDRTNHTELIQTVSLSIVEKRMF